MTFSILNTTKKTQLEELIDLLTENEKDLLLKLILNELELQAYLKGKEEDTCFIEKS